MMVSSWPFRVREVVGIGEDQLGFRVCGTGAREHRGREVDPDPGRGLQGREIARAQPTSATRARPSRPGCRYLAANIRR